MTRSVEPLLCVAALLVASCDVSRDPALSLRREARVRPQPPAQSEPAAASGNARLEVQARDLAKAPAAAPLLNSGEPRVAWRFQSATPATGAPALAESGAVYLASVEGYVHALDADGTFRWSRAIEGTPLGSPVVDRNGQVYVATREQRVYALRMDGRTKWQHRSPVRLASAPILAPAGVLYYAGRDTRLYALSTWGGPLWSRALADAITTPPAPLASGWIAISTDRPELWFTRGAATSSRLPLPATLRQPILAAGARVYAVADAELLAIEAGGDPQIEYRTEAHAAALSPDAGWLLVAFRRQLRWLEPQTGQVLHAAELPGEPSGAPAVTNGGVALVPMPTGDLLVLAPGQRLSVRVGIGAAPLWPPRWDQANQRALVVSSGVVACVDMRDWPASPSAGAPLDEQRGAPPSGDPARSVPAPGEGT